MLIQLSLKSHLLTVNKDADMLCNVLSVMLEFKKKVITFTLVYRPPDASVEDTKCLISYLAAVNQKSQTWFLTGDFNLPKTEWLMTANIKKDGCHDALQEAFDELLLHKLVCQLPHGDNILDLFLTNMPELINELEVIPSIERSHHNALFIQVNYVITSFPMTVGTKIDYFKAALLLH